ncbi:hypothetical protein GCM10027589_50300 [Actinocorallia lasiicapitis]
MSLLKALGMLADDWTAVRARFPSEQGAELDFLVGLLADEGDDAERRALGRRVADLLRAVLPKDHPIRVELRRGDRSTALQPEWRATTERLGHGRDPARTTQEKVAAALRARYDRVAMLVRPVRELDRYRPWAICFPDGDLVRLPAFQFRDFPEPWPVVVEVNGLLDAADDPRGVLDWWGSRNARCGGSPPADLIGTDPAPIVAAARALVEAD